MKTKVLILGSNGFIGKNLLIYFSNKKNIQSLQFIISLFQRKLRMLNILRVISQKKYLLKK